MQILFYFLKRAGFGIVLTALAVVSLGGCYGSGDGPAIGAHPQTISFGTAPPLVQGNTATVAATASSGLAVTYSSTTPTVCSVQSGTGAVTANTAGTCIIAADQSGNSQYSPAPQVTQSLPVIVNPDQTISFGALPPLSLGGTASVTATASSGLPVAYSSTTPTVCTVDSSTGLVTDLTAGVCTVAANQSGDAFFNAAPQVTQSMTVSVSTDVITAYTVTETFQEPDTYPKNTLFIGTFTFNATTGAVSDLRGSLSEAMTGGAVAYPHDTMTWLPLNYQLSAVPVTLGGVDGLLVTTFMQNTRNTFTTNPTFNGTDGWSPGTGFALYYGFPGANSGNAYAMIFVNTKDPTAALTQTQIDKLAYADCAPGGMMGGTCMTGTTVAGYGTLGSMSGHPVSQAITKQ